MAIQKTSAIIVVMTPLKCINPAVITINTAKYMAVKAWRMTLFCLRGTRNRSADIMSNRKNPTTAAINIGGSPVFPKNDRSSAPVAKPAPITVLMISSINAIMKNSDGHMTE